jgi:hypothetical protein
MMVGMATNRWYPYLAAAGIAAVLVAAVLRPWEYAHDYVFTSGNDWLWQQAVFQMHADGGPWGATDHLSWPIGANAWRLPQFGLGVGFFAWVTVGWFGMGTASATLWFLVFATAIDAVAMVFLFHRVTAQRSEVFVVAVAVSISATVFLVTHHLNNAFFAVLPISFGVLVAATGRAGGRAAMPTTRALALVGLFAVIAPLWWVSVLLLALPFVALPFVARRRWWPAASVGVVWAAIALAGVVQATLHAIARNGGPGADTTRAPWASNDLAGHLVDMFIGSPILRRLAPGLTERLAEGASIDTVYGLPFIAATALVVTMLLVGPPRRHGDGPDLTVLGALSVTFVLFWLGGGLGNLQAAVAVMFGTASPARGWYRMIVPLAVIGAAWLTVFGPRRRQAVAASVVAILMIVVVDLALVDDRSTNWTTADRPQRDRAAITFLEERTQPCAVAQLPHDAMPGGVLRRDFASTWLYRGMVPYVIAPDYRWTAGSYRVGDADDRDLVADVSFDAGDVDIARLAERGFCAVLYDRVVGDVAVGQDARVPGRTLTVSRPADYVDDRYALYLLDPRP